MNKKLLALAIGAVAALPAAVLAAGPTLYGQIDVSLQKDRLESPANSSYSNPNGWFLTNNASRIGVRGDADTSVSDVKGIYQAEYGIDATDGTLFTQRDIFVGLQSGTVGTLKLGTMDTILKRSRGRVDQFQDTVADIYTVVPGQSRDKNTIMYSTPAFLDNALTISAAHQPSGDNVNKPYELGVTYDKSGLYLAVATDKRINNGSTGLKLGNATTGDLGGVDLGNTSAFGGGAASPEMDATRIVAQYSTDSFNVGGLYQQAKDNYTIPGTTLKDTSAVVSGAFIMDAWKFKAQYMQTKGSEANIKLTGVAVGADYALGKSTTVYTLGGRFQTDDNPKSLNADTFAIGVRQKF